MYLKIRVRSTCGPCYLLLCYSQFRPFTDQKAVKKVNNKGKTQFYPKLMVLLFEGSANSDGNLYYKINKVTLNIATYDSSIDFLNIAT